MSVIAIQGIRGGIGTSSIISGLAWELKRLGKSVLVIDFSFDNLLRLHFNMSFGSDRGWARADIDDLGWQNGAMRYGNGLDFLPFGQISPSEYDALVMRFAENVQSWQDNLDVLKKVANYDWILLDVPFGDSILTRQALGLADKIILLLAADPNCHTRLHQQSLPVGCHFLLNKFNANHQLQQDLYFLWAKSLAGLLPLVIHQDESLPEALANNQPVGEFCPIAPVVHDLAALAHWCQIHVTHRQSAN